MSPRFGAAAEEIASVEIIYCFAFGFVSTCLKCVRLMNVIEFTQPCFCLIGLFAGFNSGDSFGNDL